MPFILDDTEVNEPVYKDFVKALKLRKRKRSVLALRVRRLEATVQHLQEQIVVQEHLKVPAAGFNRIEAVKIKKAKPHLSIKGSEPVG